MSAPARAALPAATILLFTVGAISAVYGAAIPELRLAFTLTAAAAGGIISAHYVGNVIGVLMAALPWPSRGRARLAAGGALVAAAGALTITLGATWPVVLAGASLLGLGCGLVAAHVTAWSAVAFGPRAPAVVVLLSSAFVAGAVLGPVGVAVTAGLSLGFRALFLMASVILLASTPSLSLLPLPPRLAVAVTPAFRPTPLAAFVILFVLYGGLESSSSGWIATHMVSLGAGGAALVASGFWAGMFAGRLLATTVSLRIPAPVLVTGALLIAAAAYVLAAVPGLAWLAYPLAGFCLAAVFPMGIVWASQSVGLRAIPVVMASAALGGAAFPPLVGAVIGAAGIGAIPWSLLALCVGALLVAATLRWRGQVTMLHAPA